MKKKIATTAWDAELNTDVCDAYNNADLTITLNMGFKQINPLAGAATGTYNDYGGATTTARKIVKWSTAEWARWKSEFVLSARKYWQGNFWLINNFSTYEFEDKGVKYIPNLWCRFNLTGGDAGAGSYHHVIEVVRLHKSETWFGSHSRLYDSLDTSLVQKGSDSKGKPIMQRAHVHEVGHLLGLGHVDIGKTHCPPGGNTNLSPCYGVLDRDKNSVMGQGMQLRDKHANPWRRAIRLISGKGNMATMTDWAPKKIRHYPRTLAEVASNTQVTTVQLDNPVWQSMYKSNPNSTSMRQRFNQAVILCLWLVVFPTMACENKSGVIAMNSNASCQLTPLKKSQHMIRFVLDDLSTSYAHEGGGGISEIRQIATNVFRVSIAQEERIDQITYELELNEACEVKVLNREVTAVSPWETG